MSTPTLLNLPPELQDRIFKALLVEDGITSLQHSFAEPKLSQVCRSLRKETLDVFYHDSTFCIDNDGGHIASMKRLSQTLGHLHSSDLASIRHIRLDWNTRCQGNWKLCFDLKSVPKKHQCLASDVGWSTPGYMVACYITLVPREPWAELSISFPDNALSKVVATPLHERMSEVVLPTLASLLRGGRQHKQLTRPYLKKIAKAWQHTASELLGRSCMEMQSQHLIATGRMTPAAWGNHAYQDYQVQLMLLEQQNKKRLLMARQQQDAMA
ncbi:hypothetical protein LTR97_004492 [Elasticomyces elasticus]|uniref:F-box domain-containing protein n=1 Tax=Elasticomyces elasticus TaxID=574655 RepID=A0AAN7WDI7_9PEZI|nr:hypothetical protein LTR97_004492 [Elasticomyces elasticus]